MLEAINLACSRGEHRLFTGVNFSLAPGELMQVEGANGSGKTSLLRTLCGFIPCDEGEIRWGGQALGEVSEHYRAAIIYLGHHNAIKDEFSAVENLCFSTGLAGCRISEQTAVAALRRMGLRGRERLPVNVLSQGQRRRVALARLLVDEARLWILDEPLTALDVGAVELMQELIGEHLSKGGAAIFTTHQPLAVVGVQTKRLLLT